MLVTAQNDDKGKRAKKNPCEVNKTTNRTALGGKAAKDPRALYMKTPGLYFSHL